MLCEIFPTKPIYTRVTRNLPQRKLPGQVIETPLESPQSLAELAVIWDKLFPQIAPVHVRMLNYAVAPSTQRASRGMNVIRVVAFTEQNIEELKVLAYQNTNSSHNKARQLIKKSIRSFILSQRTPVVPQKSCPMCGSSK